MKQPRNKIDVSGSSSLNTFYVDLYDGQSLKGVCISAAKMKKDSLLLAANRFASLEKKCRNMAGDL